MAYPADAVRALLLLIVVNSLPWALGRALSGRWCAPLDFGLALPDGRRVFGPHKTWRGLGAAACGGALAASLLGLHWWTGVEFAALSLLGDVFSSLCKRRLAVPPGHDVWLLDQLPEALLPLIALRGVLILDWAAIATLAATFTLLDLLASGDTRRRLRLFRPRRSSESPAPCAAPPVQHPGDDR
jgi:CDP-diglyceride synthetase